MKNYDFYSGLFMMVLSVGTCIMSYRLGLGQIHDPGPGFLPFGVAAPLGLMSIGLFLRGLFGGIKVRQEGGGFKGIAWGRVIMVLFVLLGYGIAFNFLGFNICTFLLMTLLLGVLGRRKWWLTLIISLLTVLCAYFIFVVWLRCPFPRGPFGI